MPDKYFHYLKPNNIVKLYRGDSFDLYFDIPGEDFTEYQINDNDNIYFGVCEPDQQFEEAVLKKVYLEIVEETEQVGNQYINTMKYNETGDIITIKDDDDNIIKYCVKIKSEDTEHLVPGVYYYSIKLQEKHIEDNELTDKVRTIINRTKFIILD